MSTEQQRQKQQADGPQDDDPADAVMPQADHDLRSVFLPRSGVKCDRLALLSAVRIKRTFGFGPARERWKCQSLSIFLLIGNAGSTTIPRVAGGGVANVTIAGANNPDHCRCRGAGGCSGVSGGASGLLGRDR
jgi:hypothetical protein